MKIPARTTRRQEALELIRAALLRNEFPAGSHITEAQLAERLNMSRVPVREAILQLDREGLLELLPHRGAMVVGLPDQELGLIYELRAIIEAEAFARAARLAGQDGLDELSQIVEEMRHGLRNRSAAGVSALDLRFHAKVLELAEMRFLRRLWASLSGIVRLRTYDVLDRPGLTSNFLMNTMADGHRDLVDVLRAGDPQRAADAITRHILLTPRATVDLERPGSVPMRGPVPGSTEKTPRD